MSVVIGRKLSEEDTEYSEYLHETLAKLKLA